MARDNQFNPVGPKPLDKLSPTYFSLQNFANEFTPPEKWIIAALLGIGGGGLAYFIYKKKANRTSTPAPTQRNNRQPNRSVEAEFSCIQDLPPEIRTVIWQTLPYEDILNLRLTSQFIKSDVDNNVGLTGRITTGDPEKYDFFQKIALQSCRITELENPIDDDFLLNPNLLTNLEIREHTPIPIENIRAVLAVSFNLRNLKLRLTLSDNTEGISKVILECLPSMKRLNSLHVKTRPRYTPDTKRFREVPPFSGPKLIKSIHLEMPDLPEGELSKWKCVLDKQINLESLTSNLGNVNWRFYERPLAQNGDTLEKIVLEGLRGWNTELDLEDPFDWSVFSRSWRLRSLDLSCNRGGDPHDLMNSINFERLPCVGIEEFFISRIILQPEAVDKVYTEMLNLQRGALDHIGDAGIVRANQNAWLIHQEEERLHEHWWEEDRLWELVWQGIFGMAVAVMFVFVVKLGVAGGSHEFGPEGDDILEIVPISSFDHEA